MKRETIRAKTREQIADEYGVSPRTLRRLLKNHNIKLQNRLLYPKDQLKIYNTFGTPVKYIGD